MAGNARSDPDPPEHEARHPTPDQLSERERAQERLAREAAAEADSDQEARTNLRRADKAQYLRDKLEQQTRADEEADRGTGPPR